MTEIICSDNMMFFKSCPSDMFDSCVTDPPYGWKFMGKKWDYEIPKVALWEEVYRCMKPGAFILVACGTRTQHRMAVNIEDAGFEIRDIITWHYGSGFPKSMDISKQIDKIFKLERNIIGTRESPSKKNAIKIGKWGYKSDDINISIPLHLKAKQWEGYGTALKPATELWTLARKPPEGTIANNVLKYGVGGLNIDGCRIPLDGEDQPTGSAKRVFASNQFTDDKLYGENKTTPVTGRFPANVIFECFFDTICILDEKFLFLQELIKDYYGNSYLSAVQNSISNISEQGNQQEKILLKEMLLEKFRTNDDGSKSSNVREKTFRTIIGENERNEKVKSKKGEGKSCLQGKSLFQGLSLFEYTRIIEGSTSNGIINDNEGETIYTRTQTNNGNENRQTTKKIGSSTSCKRSKRRQPTRESGNNDKSNTQSETSRNIERNEIITKAKGRIAVFNTDLPDLFKKYFINTNIEIKHFASTGALLDQQSGMLKSGDSDGFKGEYSATIYGEYANNQIDPNTIYADSGGASRYFYCAKASGSERDRGLNEYSLFSIANNTGNNHNVAPLGRETEYKNNHPTVKPISLMRYLVRLITPPNGLCIDPFNGSGSTGIACKLEGFDYIGIEMDQHFCEISEKRIKAYG
jgi:DNA modification methylase